MKTYYELLDIAPGAHPEEIKRAFRREIAKYHPDKVQHLGKEFQEIAAVKASELTQAYKTLTDAQLRAEYDETIGETGVAPAPRENAPGPPPPKAESRPVPPPPPVDPAPPRSVLGEQFAHVRIRVAEFVLRAAAGRFRAALRAEFSQYDELQGTGFDVTCVPRANFWTRQLPPRIMLRVVQSVDAATVAEVWTLASRLKKEPQRDICVFLMGPAIASAEDLARAIAEQRRKPLTAGRKLVVVPVSTENWRAHVPADAHPVVKSLLSRLQV